MSEQAPEGAPPQNSGGGGNALTRQYGPLPLWAWLAVAFLGFILIYLWRKNSSSATSGASGTGTGTTNSSLIPQFVNQVETDVYPPSDETDNDKPPKPGPHPKTKNPTSTDIANNHLTPISPGQALELLKRKERPFIWNGTGFEPATKLAKGVQYYAGQLETEQLNAENDKAAKHHPVSHPPVHHHHKPPVHHRGK